MGKHDKHLPARRHLNKTVGHGSKGQQPADAKTLGDVASKQGTGTKADANAAKAAEPGKR